MRASRSMVCGLLGELRLKKSLLRMEVRRDCSSRAASQTPAEAGAS